MQWCSAFVWCSINKVRKTELKLGANAAIVHQPFFETAITKIQNYEEHSLTANEKLAVVGLKKHEVIQDEFRIRMKTYHLLQKPSNKVEWKMIKGHNT